VLRTPLSFPPCKTLPNQTYLLPAPIFDSGDSRYPRCALFVVCVLYAVCSHNVNLLLGQALVVVEQPSEHRSIAIRIQTIMPSIWHTYIPLIRMSWFARCPIWVPSNATQCTCKLRAHVKRSHSPRRTYPQTRLARACHGSDKQQSYSDYDNRHTDVPVSSSHYWAYSSYLGQGWPAKVRRK